MTIAEWLAEEGRKKGIVQQLTGLSEDDLLAAKTE